MVAPERAVERAGIRLAPFCERMSTRTISSSGEIAGEAPTGSAAIDPGGAQTADFAALLFLLLAPLAPNTPGLETAESSITTARAEAGGTAEAFDAVTTEPMAGSLMSDGYRSAGRAEPSAAGAAVAVSAELSFPQRMSPYAQAAALDGSEKLPHAGDADKQDTEDSATVAESPWISPESSRFDVSNSSATMIARPADAVGGAKALLSANALPVGSDAINFPGKGSDNQQVQAGLRRGAEDMRAAVPMEPVQAPADVGNSAASATEALDQLILASAAESRVTGVANNTSAQAVPAAGDLFAPFGAPHGEHSSAGDGRAAPVDSSEARSDSEPHGALSAALDSSIRQMREFESGAEEHDFHEHDREEFLPASAPSAATTTAENLAREALHFELENSTGKLPAAMRPETQAGHWRPIIDQVIGEISGQIRIGKQQAVLQLDPPELGKLQIDLVMDGDKLAARIVTETQESRALIEMHLPELRQALGESRVELVDVRVDSGAWTGFGGVGQEAGQQSDRGRQTADEFNSPGKGNAPEPEPRQSPANRLQAGTVSMWA